MKTGKLSIGLWVWLCLAMAPGVLSAADLRVEMKRISAQGVGESLGTIEFRDSSEFGLLIIPDLKGLTEGVHGFHVHQHPDCSPDHKMGEAKAGLSAGGHYDPGNTGRHEGPVGDGHLGDMPVLVVDGDGRARMAMFAPRLQTPDLVGRALMVHEGGDNYSDEPKALGGGGARVACGVVDVDNM